MSQDLRTSNSIAEALHDWLRSCPQLKSGAKVGADYLPDRETEYAIIAMPSSIQSRENVLGEEVLDPVQTQNFTFASKKPYGADIAQNLANQAFYEGVTAWIWEQNAQRRFPRIPGGTVKSIVPTLTAYIADAGADVARYQISLKLTYRIA